MDACVCNGDYLISNYIYVCMYVGIFDCRRLRVRGMREYHTKIHAYK